MSQQYPPPPPAYGQQPGPPPEVQGKPSQVRRWPWILGIVLAFFAGCGIGSGSSGASNTAATAGATKTVQAPPSTVTVAAAAPAEAPAPAAPAPAAGGPQTTFSDGTYEVGTGAGQVAPGKYTTPGGGTCYWARLKHNDGALGDIIANNLGEGQMILNVKKGDGYVEIRGCEFTKSG